MAQGGHARNPLPDPASCGSLNASRDDGVVTGASLRRLQGNLPQSCTPGPFGVSHWHFAQTPLKEGLI